MALACVPPLGAQGFPAPAVVVSDSVRIRSQPSLSGRVEGKLDHGTRVTVLARSRTPMAVTRGGERHWWYRVRTADMREGWMYGAYVYLESAESGQPDLSFKVQAADRTEDLTARLFTSELPARPGQARTLVAAADGAGGLHFIRIPDALVGLVRAYRSEDHWYVMLSDRAATQSLESVSVMEDKNLVTFEISERAGGRETYRISLTCSYNVEKQCFEVEYSETVPE